MHKSNAGMHKAEEGFRSKTVTVLMASYGRLDLLKESVDSALKQTYPDFDILIVDDGSDNETKDWLRTTENSHECVRVMFNQHQGVAAARNTGVRAAKGELICILDSDDTLVPHALQTLVDTLERFDTALVYSNIRERRAHADVVIEYPEFNSAAAMLRATLLKPRVPFKHTGTMFIREVALSLGSYDTGLPCKVDIDLYLKFLQAGHLPKLVKEPLVDFKMHKDSISRDRSQGIQVWNLLIDRYGPSNPIQRFFIKTMRRVSENLKRIYIELTA